MCILADRFLRIAAGAWGLLLLLATQISIPLPGAEPLDRAPLVVVVTSSTADAYTDAIEGLKAELLADGVKVAVIDLNEMQGSAALEQEITHQRPELLVTIGNSAAETVATELSIPFISTMILSTTKAMTGTLGKRHPMLVGSVTLGLSSDTVVAEIRRLFPDKLSLGVIQKRSSRLVDNVELENAAQKYGFSLKVAFCEGPEDLIDQFVALKDFTDIVWTPPEFSLFNSATVKPLILASLRQRLAIIGFSSGFARAGSAVGLYPDFAAVGRQTAGLVRRYLSERQPQGDHVAQDLHIAINERVLRLLGIRVEIPKDKTDRLHVLR